jgi:hypothetical protein
MSGVWSAPSAEDVWAFKSGGFSDSHGGWCYSIRVPQQLGSPSGDVMNHYQVRILWLAIGLGSVMLAFPPWKRGYLDGYAFFMELPRRAEIDSGRLLLQLGILTLLAAGAWMTAKDERVAADLIDRARKQIPSRKGALSVVGYVSLVVVVGCVGMLLIAWDSPRGLTVAVAVPLTCIGMTALGVFLMTARHYFDSLK